MQLRILFVNYYKMISEFKLDEHYKDITNSNGTIILQSPEARMKSEE